MKDWTIPAVCGMFAVIIASLAIAGAIEKRSAYEKELEYKTKEVERLSKENEELDNENYRLKMIADESYELFINCVQTPQE